MTMVKHEDTQIVKMDDASVELASRFGGQQAFEFLMRRAAETFNVKWDDVQKYPDVRGSLVKATQWVWQYGAMPGKHIYLIPFGKKETVNNKEIWRDTYAVSDSYEWRKASADQKAKEMKWNYMVQVEMMTEEETKKYIDTGSSNPYHPSDVGAKARVLFLHEMEMIGKMNEMAKSMGMPETLYSPPWHYGFWRKNAEKRGDKYQEDQVPKGRTREWVAQKRAEKSALAQHFELRPIENWQNRSEQSKVAAIVDSLPEIERKAEDPRHSLPVLDKKLDKFTQDLMDAEPIEFREESDVLDLAASVGATVQSPEDEPSFEVGEFVDGVFSAMTEEQKKYANLVYFGEFDDEKKDYKERLGHDEKADQERVDSLRVIVSGVCGWKIDTFVLGERKADILLAVIAGRWIEGKLDISVAACTQMRKDLVKDMAQLGRKPGPNPSFNEDRWNIVAGVGKLIDQMITEEA